MKTLLGAAENRCFSTTSAAASL